MNIVKIGVVGVARGATMIRYCEDSRHAKVVAICDKWVEGLEKKKQELNDPDVTYYSDFDTFIQHDMDAVVLANYANQHAPFAIRAMAAGKHVFSEVLPVQNLAEAVELIEAVEKYGKVYAYGENYCYMAAPREMRRLYREGKLGTFEYGEGEYMHNCESIWDRCTQGNPEHWRNRMYANYYCTHSCGPLIHITGLRPVSVTGFEMPFNDRMGRMGAKAGHAAVEMVRLENGAVIKSLHGVGCSKNSIWYSIYGSLGRIESSREDAEFGGVDRVFTNLDRFEGENFDRVHNYKPGTDEPSDSVGYGHGGSDYFSMYNFVEKILGHEAEIIDVYEAMDMFLPGLLGYRSVLNGGIPMAIPDLRNKEERDKVRNDRACTDPEEAGEQLIPSYSKGNPEIPDEVYLKIKEKWISSQK